MLLLHTHRQRTRNAGDWLIQHTLRKNIAALGSYDIDAAYIGDNISSALKAGRHDRIIIAALSIFDDVYPNFMPLTGDLEALSLPIFPIGCTWQHPFGHPEFALRAQLNEATKKFFHRLVKDGGAVPVRDHQAQSILHRNEVSAKFVGDCGLYEPTSIGRRMRRDGTVRSVVFTTPHNKMYRNHAAGVISMIAEEFPDAEKYISHQSLPGTYDLVLQQEAEKKGFKTILPCERLELIEEYAQFDLHIGYRLHGHIGFLRQRVPSVLLVEDARGEGFQSSFPIGCFSARRLTADPAIAAYAPAEEVRRYVMPDEAAIPRIREFLRQERSTNFRRYACLGDMIDTAYEEAFMPALKSILS
jgi:hypothetical protein